MAFFCTNSNNARNNGISKKLLRQASFFCLSQLCRSYKARQDAIIWLYNTFCDKRDKHFSDILFCMYHFLYWVRKLFIHQIVSITIFQVKYKNWNTIKSLPWKTLSQLSQFFFRGRKWRNGAVYRIKKVRQASFLVVALCRKKKVNVIFCKSRSLIANFYLVCETKVVVKNTTLRDLVSFKDAKKFSLKERRQTPKFMACQKNGKVV